MLVKKVFRVSLIGVGFFLLTACSTGKDELEENALNAKQNADRAIVGQAGELSSFYEEEANTHPLKVGKQTYYFAFDSSVLENDAIPSLKVQAQYLLKHPQAKILIAGNTDERGSREYNIALGQRRALSVANFLKSNGVNNNQISLVSYGAEKPVAFGHSEADYAKNRRANLDYQIPVIINED